MYATIQRILASFVINYNIVLMVHFNYPSRYLLMLASKLIFVNENKHFCFTAVKLILHLCQHQFAKLHNFAIYNII